MAMIRLKVTNAGEYAQERAGYYLPPDSTTEVVISEYEETQFSASEALTVEVLQRGVDMSERSASAQSLAPHAPAISDTAKEKAEARGIDVGSVEGTGSNGRVTVKDVEREIEALGLNLDGAPTRVGGAVRSLVVEPHIETPDESHDRLEVSRANTNVEVPDVGRHVLETHNPAPPNTHREIPDLTFDSKELAPLPDQGWEWERIFDGVRGRWEWRRRYVVEPGVKTSGNVAEGVAPPLGNVPERAEAAEEVDLDPSGQRDMHEDAGLTPFPAGAARGSTRAANNLEARKAIRSEGIKARAEALVAQEEETTERLAADRQETVSGDSSEQTSGDDSEEEDQEDQSEEEGQSK